MATTDLTRTPSSGGNRKIWTFSAWLKRATKSDTNNSRIFSAGNANTDYTSWFMFAVDGTDATLQLQNRISNTTTNLQTHRKFKDVNGWYHLVIACDTTQATASNRIKIYINGSQVTAFDTEQYPAQNADTFVNHTVEHNIGSADGSGYTPRYWAGSMSHVALVDGQQLTPTSFGETDSTSGIWKFKSPSGLSWGTNGFHLKFENSGNMGLDSSGQTNNYSVSGGTMTQSLDTPTNVYAVFNPLDNFYGGSTFENANTTVYTSSSAYGINKTTIGVDSGKWYWEVKIGSNDGSGNNWYAVGISGQDITGTNQELGKYNYQIGYYGDDGSIRKNSTNLSTGTTFTTNDIIGVAMDLDNNKIYFHKNGTYINTVSGYQGNPTTGQNGFDITASPPNGFYYPCVGDWDNNNRFYFHANFGNGYFATTAVSSNSGAGEQDDGGEGIFEYDVPAGYRALNTKNLNTHG